VGTWGRTTEEGGVSWGAGSRVEGGRPGADALGRGVQGGEEHWEDGDAHGAKGGRAGARRHPRGQVAGPGGGLLGDAFSYTFVRCATKGKSWMGCTNPSGIQIRPSFGRIRVPRNQRQVVQ